MLCAISGEAPTVPVASRKSGAVFERRLIEAYITENGKDPITNEELALEDLVELRADRTVKPRPPQFTSIPSLLSAFQNEWDALALERFSVQQQLEQTRRELSRALYENDAALRVIARLQGERDEARENLAKLGINGAAGAGTNGDEAMQVDGEQHALPENLAQAVTKTEKNLSKTRRKRPVPEDWATAEDIGALKVQKVAASATPSSSFLVMDSDDEQLLHASGQPVGTVAAFSVPQKANVATFNSEHETEVMDALWVDTSKIAIGSLSGHVGTVRSDPADVMVRQSHSSKVTSVSLHPSGMILASTSMDKSVILYNLENMVSVMKIPVEVPLLNGAFHPDGHLFAAGGADGNIRIFETSSGNKAASFAAGSPIQTLSFSENGTWLAAACQGQSEVQIWDLRKAATIHTLTVDGSINCVRWDYTGQFLAIASSAAVTVYNYQKASKSWNESLKSLQSAKVVTWGKNAKALYGVDESGALLELA